VPTLVANGGKSPAWMRNAATQLADALPNVRHQTLDGQTHYVKADALVPVLSEFLHNGAAERIPGMQSSARPGRLAQI
jgi:hypothetical protein